MNNETTRRWQPVPVWMQEHPEAGNKNKVYREIGNGTLKPFKLGGRILVASDALDLLAEAQA